MHASVSSASSAAAASLSVTGRVQLPSDIACVSMNPLAAGDDDDDDDVDDIVNDDDYDQ